MKHCGFCDKPATHIMYRRLYFSTIRKFACTECAKRLHKSGEYDFIEPMSTWFNGWVKYCQNIT